MGLDVNALATRLLLEEKAGSIALRHPGPPLDIELVAREHGIHTIAVESIRQDAILVAVPDVPGYSLLLNKDSTGERQRFSIAHEIGHIILGLGRPHNYLAPVAQRSQRNAEERLVDHFAALLLMPREWVNALASREASTAALARRFRVSVPAMRRRLEELGHNALANDGKGT